MATYVNDLRLKEITTGDESGTWCASTNTNLELIAEAFSYGTEASFGSDADATTTIADGSTDPARSLYLKVTSSGNLTATRTLTIAPNTVSKVWIIENATSGSQSITIKQGTGATVTIPTGKTKMIYSDGAGSGGAMVDALASINIETSGILETSASIQTPLIEFTDGDDAITIADGGIRTFPANTVFSGNLDIAGSIDVDGTTETDALTINGSAFNYKTFGTGSLMIGDTTTGTIDAANYNTGLGVDIFAALTSGDENTAIGAFSLGAVTTGRYNTGLGKGALEANTTADFNTAAGTNAMQSNTTGAYNVAIGGSSLDANTTGDNNVSIGYQALTTETTGDRSVAIGFESLKTQNFTGGTTSHNTAVGNRTGALLTTGLRNTLIGS